MTEVLADALHPWAAELAKGEALTPHVLQQLADKAVTQVRASGLLTRVIDVALADARAESLRLADRIDGYGKVSLLRMVVGAQRSFARMVRYLHPR